MKWIISIIIFSFFSNSLFAQRPASGIKGKISDTDTDDVFIGANVVVSKNGVFVIGTSTDFEGNYTLKIDPGVYDMEVSYIGYQTKRIENIEVNAGQVTQTDVLFEDNFEAIIYDDYHCGGYYTIPLIEQDNPTSERSITDEDIRTQAQKSIPQLAGLSSPGVSILDQ